LTDQNIPANLMDDFLRTQTEIIQSRSLAETVARSLNFANRSDFLGPDVEERRPADRTDAEWEEDKVKLAAQMLQGSITAEVRTSSQIIAISAESESPALAAEIANGYAKAFVQSDVRRSIDSNAYAREYLLDQIAKVRANLNDAELAAKSYARNAGIVTQNTVSSDEEGAASTTIAGANLQAVDGLRSMVWASSLDKVPSSELERISFDIKNAPPEDIANAEYICCIIEKHL